MAANATLNLTSGDLTVESFTSGSENDIYAAGSNLHVDATLGPVSASVRRRLVPLQPVDGY